MRRITAWVGALVVAAVMATLPVRSAELAIGLGIDVSSLDPYYHNTGPNLMMSEHIFDRLVRRDGHQRMVPSLAESWRTLSDTVWEFSLRRDVVFQDGTPFTAEDVVASFERAPRIKGPSSVATYIRPVSRLEVVDEHTIRLHTNGPYPLLPNELSQFPITSRLAAAATTADFDTGTAAVGTGPFRVMSWTPGERLELASHDRSWTGKPVWDRLTFHFIPDDAQRLAALAAGQVDMVDNVPSADIARFRDNPIFQVATSQTSRVIFLRFNYGQDEPLYVRDKDGKPLGRNPFRDLRVRKAISLAINRGALRDLVMEGLAVPAAQLVPDTYFGASPRLTVQEHDTTAARQLLAEAGYPNGFAVTLHGPNNRYVNDDAICRTVALMLAPIGIDVTVETMSSQEYFPRAARHEFSFMLSGWGTGTGEASYSLKGLVGTRDSQPGWGTSNYGRYSNPKLDALLTKALATVDETARQDLLATAMDLAINDVAVVPLHFQVRAWALRKPLHYRPSAEEATLAIDVLPGAAASGMGEPRP